MSNLALVLEMLNSHYRFDGRGRIVASRGEGLSPRFVLGRAVEGCIWRFGAGLDQASIVGLARLAGREAGARFDGETTAPPERLAALERLLARSDGTHEPNSPSVPPLGATRARRVAVEREGVVVGELWSID